MRNMTNAQKKMYDEVTKETFRNKIFYPFFFDKCWEPSKMIIPAIHILLILCSWIAGKVIIIANILLFMFSFWVEGINEKRKFAPLEYNRRKLMTLRWLKSSLNSSCFNSTFNIVQKNLEDMLEPNISVWEGEIKQSVPLRIWLWTTRKLHTDK